MPAEMVTITATEAEANLIKRVRALGVGEHLMIVGIDKDSLVTVTVMAQGKRESIRPKPRGVMEPVKPLAQT